MRRTTLVITASVAALLSTSELALARDVQCPTRAGTQLCVGTSNDDTITGTNRADTIRARGGDDTVAARRGKDKVLGQGGIDLLEGGRGGDTLNGGPNSNLGLEFLSGGPGDDTLVESAGLDRYGFGPGWGQDVITGDGDQPGVQPDRDGLCFVCGSAIVSAGVTVNLALGTATDGTNNVSWDASVPFIEDTTGGVGGDNLTGSARDNVVDGHDGADTIDVSGDSAADTAHCGGDDGDPDTVTKDSEDTVPAGSCGAEDTITTVP